MEDKRRSGTALSASQLNQRCLFVGEKVTYDTAVSRCEQAGLSICAMKNNDWKIGRMAVHGRRGGLLVPGMHVRGFRTHAKSKYK